MNWSADRAILQASGMAQENFRMGLFLRYRVPVGRPDPPVEPVKARATPIQRRFLEKYGYTEGCSKCRAIQRQDETQPTLAHNAACRARIEELLKNDPEFKDKIEAQEERKGRSAAKEVERGKKKEDKVPDVREEDDIPEAEEEDFSGPDRVRSTSERPRG